MVLAFYIAAGVAVIATAAALSRANAVHALLYLVVSLFAVAVMMLLCGAPFVAALEVIIYAGAIVVVFLFVVMMLGFTRADLERERSWIEPRNWIGPGALAAVLVLELAFALSAGAPAGAEAALGAGSPAELGRALFGPYLLAVELASMVLLAGLVGAFHVGRRRPRRARGEGEEAER